jgi:hypothetical protein
MGDIMASTPRKRKPKVKLTPEQQHELQLALQAQHSIRVMLGHDNKTPAGRKRAWGSDYHQAENKKANKQTSKSYATS